ncbi:MAG TPA: histidine kinase dimerization/phospho-acceptor domain-containing protein, partial [Candidatus Micrarchaeota archaeon]|nr:histidine kinase dimerization/phospho-acceptor domain-containing protein [Candidatus Micrarchaeota archaeon]
KAVEILGYSPKEFLGQNIFSFITSKKRKEVEKLREWSEGNVFMFKSMPLNKKGGGVLIADIHIMDTLFGEQRATLVVAIDITEKVKAEKMLDGYAKKLEEQVQARTAQYKNENMKVKELLRTKDDFIRDIGHELKTPLSVMMGNIALLKMPETLASPKKYGDIMDMFERNAGRLSASIDQILA